MWRMGNVPRPRPNGRRERKIKRWSGFRTSAGAVCGRGTANAFLPRSTATPAPGLWMPLGGTWFQGLNKLPLDSRNPEETTNVSE